MPAASRQPCAQSAAAVQNDPVVFSLFRQQEPCPPRWQHFVVRALIVLMTGNA
jgi:hypothetical protein